MTDTLVNIAPGCYIDPTSVESIEIQQNLCGCRWKPDPDDPLGGIGSIDHTYGGSTMGIMVTTHGGHE